MTSSSSLSSICVAGLSGRVVCPSSFFVVAGHRVPVMWALAINRQWAVNRGGAVLVGWVVIGVVGLLTVCKRTNDDDDDIVIVIDLCGMVLRLWHVPVVVFRGRWSSCASCCLCCVWVPLLCVGAIVVRWLWLFAGRLSSFRGWGCLRWWRLRYVA